MNIGKIRNVLTREFTETLVHAFVSSRVDNGNALLYGIPMTHLGKLQNVLNTGARIISRTGRFDLHWLPIKERTEYKILLPTYKALHGMAPDYLADFLAIYQPGRSLRSQGRSLLKVPNTSLRGYGDRAYPKAAALLWNALQIETMFDDQAVAKFKRGPISTTRVPSRIGSKETESSRNPSARMSRRRCISSSNRSRLDSILKQ